MFCACFQCDDSRIYFRYNRLFCTKTAADSRFDDTNLGLGNIQCVRQDTAYMERYLCGADDVQSAVSIHLGISTECFHHGLLYSFCMVSVFHNHITFYNDFIHIAMFFQTACTQIALVVRTYRAKWKGLQNEINKKRREANLLNARIDKLIAEEIERARKRAQEEARREAAARKKEESKEGKSAATETAAKSKPLEAYTMSKADRELSGNFAANRGKLPMPISGAYIITSRYGQYAVEGLRNVKLDNKGIDIQGKPGAQARAIFDGKVAAVFQLNGLFNVLIRHGNYISVYCNLSSASVKAGDTVKTGI